MTRKKREDVSAQDTAVKTSDAQDSPPEIPSSEPEGPNEALARRVIDELIARDLISAADGERVRGVLALGKLDASGWKLVFENRIEKREAEDERE
jgi:hypothetical protein